MPQFKFGSNDIFHNVIKAHPKYTISMYLNQIYINNRISQGDQVPSGSISLYEMVVDPNTSSLKKHRTGAGAAGGNEAIDNYFPSASYAYLLSNESGEKVTWTSRIGHAQDFSGKKIRLEHSHEWNAEVSKGENKEIKSFYPILSKVVERFLIIGNSGSNTAFTGVPDGTSNGKGGINPPYDGVTDDPYVATASNVHKLIALKNAYDKYRVNSPHFDFDKYILVSGGIPPTRGFYSADGNCTNRYRPDRSSDCRRTYTENGGGVFSQGPLTIKTIYHPPGLMLKTAAGANVDFDPSIPNFTQSIPRNKYTNVLVVPKIVYGDEIKKGSVKLEFYFTGTLVARAEDSRENGELVETYLNPDACDRSTTGSVIGVVMYNEGIFIITSSVPFRASDPGATVNTTGLIDGYLCPTGSRNHKCCGAHGVTTTDASRPPAGGEGQAMSASYVTASSWAHFGAYKSLVTSSNAHLLSSSRAPCSSSYLMEFRGTTHTPVLTMMAHAKKNELNWSNNPSYISSSNRASASAGKTAYANTFIDYTGSHEYKEREEIKIKNIISSSFAGHSSSVDDGDTTIFKEKSAEFEPQTFISKIAIYNKNKELIAVTKLANPVKKTNDQDFTFKMKLDL